MHPARTGSVPSNRRSESLGPSRRFTDLTERGLYFVLRGFAFFFDVFLLAVTFFFFAEGFLADDFFADPLFADDFLADAFVLAEPRRAGATAPRSADGPVAVAVRAGKMPGDWMAAGWPVPAEDIPSQKWSSASSSPWR